MTAILLRSDRLELGKFTQPSKPPTESAGSNGSLGIKALKEAGGLILVQDPHDAEFGQMPRSAIAIGVVDLVLPVSALAERFAQITKAPSRFAQPTVERAADSEDVFGASCRCCTSAHTQDGRQARRT